MLIELNSRKKEITDQMNTMLQNSVDLKVMYDTVAYANLENKLTEVDSQIAAANTIQNSRSQLSVPREQVVLPANSNSPKFFAMSGSGRHTTALPTITADVAKGFWPSLKTRSAHEQFIIQNATLGEGGSAAAGGSLVPIMTDITINPLAIQECSARGLSRVVPTQRNLVLAFQAALSTAAIKPETNSTGTNAFVQGSPSFGNTTLTSFMVGGQVPVSWELLEDDVAVQAFVPFDLQRAIVVQEEANFIGTGSGNSLTGTGQPQGYLGNALLASGQSITSGAAAIGIDPIIDTLGSLNKAYYMGAKWLVNRQEFNRLLKAQIAANQYQTFVTFDPNGAARLFGYNVEFSGSMPVFAASPAVSGAWLFGDFASFAVIGDRGGSDIRVKVLDQIQAQDAVTVLLAYRRTDQRILIGNAVVQMNTNG